MSDEIKETLEYLKICVEDDTSFETTNCKALLDYITNLREEKDKFKLRCFKALKLIRDNYGVLDKYGIDLLDDILNGEYEK